MCEGFGMIVGKDMKTYFTMPNRGGDISHSEILKALGRKDSKDQFLRNFVRVQCRDWKLENFEFDEVASLPGWAEENKDEIKSAVGKALRRAAKALAEYEKVKTKALAEYEKVAAPALAEYEKVKAPALAEYEKVKAPAWAEYEKVAAKAWAEYEKVKAKAWAEYEKVKAKAWAEYEKVKAKAWGRLRDRLALISGFVE